MYCWVSYNLDMLLEKVRKRYPLPDLVSGGVGEGILKCRLSSDLVFPDHVVKTVILACLQFMTEFLCLVTNTTPLALHRPEEGLASTSTLSIQCPPTAEISS